MELISCFFCSKPMRSCFSFN